VHTYYGGGCFGELALMHGKVTYLPSSCFYY
jgi:hypothetical protein